MLPAFNFHRKTALEAGYVVTQSRFCSDSVRLITKTGKPVGMIRKVPNGYIPFNRAWPYREFEEAMRNAINGLPNNF